MAEMLRDSKSIKQHKFVRGRKSISQIIDALGQSSQFYFTSVSVSAEGSHTMTGDLGVNSIGTVIIATTTAITPVEILASTSPSSAHTPLDYQTILIFTWAAITCDCMDEYNKAERQR